MSNGLNKTSARQQQRSLSDRVGALEENLARALMGINQRFQAADGRLINLEELVEALTDLNGSQEVQDYVDGKRLERAEKLAAQEKATLDEAVADGYVIAAETTGDKSIIVGKYLNAEGAIIPPGRAQLVMTGVQPQFREQLLGKGVGTQLDLPNNEKFELLEIYNVDEEKAREVMTAKAAKAVDDAAKAAAAAATEETAAAGDATASQ